ncbi:MAG TPA: MCE family protein [Nocardioidaceae bacterium]|nr:MCE family protein [Nocardioidaceae bacterium]
MRRALLVAAAAALLTGCSFDGVQNLALPGGEGKGDGAYTVTVELPDVGTLTENAEVKVGDIAVGTVTGLTAVDWHAEATVTLNGDVELPANAVARVGVNSLLGSSFIELAPPASPAGRLEAEGTIPLANGSAYPATEQVLASASVVLNGSGLEQLSTITAELNKAVNSNDQALGDLLPRLDTFLGALDAQRGDIVTAIRDMDRLSGRFARNRGTLTKALDELGPALRALSAERPNLTSALQSLRRLGDVATPLVTSAKADLVANLRDIVPALKALSRAGDSVTKALGFAVTFPFAPETVANACKSDYCNLFLTLDLRTEALVNGFIGPDGKPAIPGMPGLTPLTDILSGLLPSLPALPGLDLSKGVTP